MREIRNKAVIETISEEVRAFGIKRVAPEINKEASSLYGELNPYGDQGKAKLSYDDAIETMRVIGSVESLRIAAESLGYRLEKVQANPDGKNMHHECLQVSEAVTDFTRAATAKNTSKRELLFLKGKVVKEVEDVVERYKEDKHDG